VSTSLAGRAVVVTRPAQQSAGTVAALRALGAQVVEFPAIRIEPIETDPARAQVVPEDLDWLIYTSANAVAFAARFFKAPTRARVAAIGPATAQALRHAGLRVEAQPQRGADSESLLELPVFTNPQGLRVLILRGTDGRDYLRRELERRGAVVQALELYRRVRVTPTPAAICELSAALASGTAMIAVTSVDVLRALVRIVPAALDASLRAAALVVPGPRVAAAARALAWRGELIEAASAEDSAMVRALVDGARDAGRVKGA
jgi:uroporphyrinogen-III synthase